MLEKFNNWIVQSEIIGSELCVHVLNLFSCFRTLVAIEVNNENVYPIAYHVRNHVIDERGECCSGSGVCCLKIGYLSPTVHVAYDLD